MEIKPCFILIKEYLGEGWRKTEKSFLLQATGIIFSQEVRKQERNLQEHQSECLALRSSGRINSSMTIKTSFLLIEVLSSPTQHSNTSHTATSVPSQKQHTLQVFTQLTGFCNTEPNYQSLSLQTLLLLNVYSKLCKILLLESSQSQKGLTKPG